MIGLIVLGLALLFFIVVAFFAAKTWHVGHIVSMCFLFLFSLLMLFMTSTLMRTHNEYRPKYSQAVKDIETQQERTRSLTFGNPAEPAGEDSLVGERALAKVELATRGRVWRNVRGRPVGPGGPIQLDMRRWDNDGCLRVGQDPADVDEEIEPVADPEASGDEVDPADAAGDPASSHGIVAGQFVFAFKEFPISLMSKAEQDYYFDGLGEGEDGFAAQDAETNSCRVPVTYLGKFIVQDANPQMVTVVPAEPLTPGQAKLITNQATWVLYEKLPTDSHDVFSGLDAAALAGLVPLRRLAELSGVQLMPAVHQGMLNEYARDGKEYAGPLPNWRAQQTVKFLKDHEQVVDLVVEGDLPPTDKPFDALGRAQVKSLLQGEPTKFAKDDVATFDSFTAAQLIANGIAQPEGKPTYSRVLRNFEAALGNSRKQLESVAKQTRVVQAQVEELTASLQRLQEQIDKHAAELRQLTEDQRGFELERDQLREFKRLLEQRRSMLEGEVDRMLTSI